MKVEDIKNLAVIGAGDMGHGIAEVALIAGYKVYLRDISNEAVAKGVKNVHQSLEKLVSKGKVTPEHHAMIKSDLLVPCVELKRAIQKADLVIEAVPEIVEVKKEIFHKIDQIAQQHTLMASNTSTIKISEIASATKRPEKVLGLHYFNPAVLMQLVEVVRGEKTSDETMHLGHDFVINTNKIPVRVEKDMPGFIVNRIEAPYYVLLDCILDEGIAEPEAVDAMMRKHGMPMGPYEIMDFTGIDIGYHASKYFAIALHPDFMPGRIVKDMVESGNLGKKTGRGFFNWSEGRPKIDFSKAAENINPMDFEAVKINEATKIIKLGVCSATDIDKAMVNGTGATTGLIEIARRQDPADLVRRLEDLAEKFSKEIFRPTQMVREGTY